jgi:hypothetical protein
MKRHAAQSIRQRDERARLGSNSCTRDSRGRFAVDLDQVFPLVAPFSEVEQSSLGLIILAHGGSLLVCRSKVAVA